MKIVNPEFYFLFNFDNQYVLLWTPNAYCDVLIFMPFLFFECVFIDSQCVITLLRALSVALFTCIPGKYGCHVTKVTPSTSPQVISTLSVSVELQVHVPAVEGQAEVTPSPVVFPFLPAFYVHNTEISVTTVSPLTTVRVSTIPDLASCIQVCRALGTWCMYLEFVVFC